MYDPGGTTGYCRVDDGKVVEWGEFSAEDTGVLDAQIARGDTVVYETIYPHRPSLNPIGIEVIGAIKHVTRRARATLVPQSPSIIAGVKRWPAYRHAFPGVSDHVRDALCHAIVYMRGEITFSEYLVDPDRKYCNNNSKVEGQPTFGEGD